MLCSESVLSQKDADFRGAVGAYMGPPRRHDHDAHQAFVEDNKREESK